MHRVTAKAYVFSPLTRGAIARNKESGDYYIAIANMTGAAACKWVNLRDGSVVTYATEEFALEELEPVRKGTRIEILVGGGK